MQDKLVMNFNYLPVQACHSSWSIQSSIWQWSPTENCACVFHSSSFLKLKYNLEGNSHVNVCTKLHA